MKPFIHNDFLLEGDTARGLYHDHAAAMPIIDYHNHLSPKMIAENHRFASLTELWLGGDHYKWRAMRANGVGEEYITGDAPDREKFMKWAETVPYTMRNPLYHWTHLELTRYFGIDLLLNGKTGPGIYDACNERLKEEAFSARGLLEKMKVEALCTTDDPADRLEHHTAIAADSKFKIKVLPTWRPDKTMAVENPAEYNAYIDRLAAAAGVEISNFGDLLKALKKRQHAFASAGCRLSDHGLSEVPDGEVSDEKTAVAFAKIRGGTALSPQEANTFKTGMLCHLLAMNHEMEWTQQLHIGAIRNNNLRLFSRLGPDIGCDSIGDGPVAAGLSRVLGVLDREDMLSRTILYNLNPKETEVMATMAGNFNAGEAPGKMQYGAAWWFLDQLDGMEKQLNALSSLGLLSRFVGMLTDSRSFVSFPRHEYFRRLLCNVLGRDIDRGLLPRSEMAFIGRMVEDICYHNAKRYFGF